jgi:3-hydroxy-5-methyl-1-naphthoate 3-O-methyltransferase
MSTAQGGARVTPERILQMAWGYGPPLIIEAAVRQGVFDHLESGPKTVEEMASLTGASIRGLRAIMNALAGLELLAKSGGRYSLTPESAEFLVSSKPAYHGGFFRHMSELIPKWLDIAAVVQTGQPGKTVNEESHGADFFTGFVDALFPLSYPATQALAGALELDQAQQPVTVLDLAAGSGVWGIGLAKRSPQVTLTAVDWPDVLEITRRNAERHGLASRFTFVPGDLAVADFGRGHNVATLGHILHSEGEKRGRALLKKTSDALAPGGTIAIAEFVADEERSTATGSLLFAVNMLIATESGDTFTFNEIASWLDEAGFVNPRTLDAPGPSPLILATKPS